MKDTFPPSRSTDTDTDRHAAAVPTETSPSAGWREVAHALHAPEAHVADAGAPPDDREHLEDMNIGEGEPSPSEVAG